MRRREPTPAPSTIVVREAKPDDVGDIARVHIQAWQVAYAHVFPAEALEGLSSGFDRRAAFWRQTIDAEGTRAHTLVGQDGDRIVGFASIGPTRDVDLDPEHVGELYAIYVLPDAWGKGVGQALMRKLVGELHADGFHEAILWVLEDNPRTRRFYELARWRLDGADKDDTIFDTSVREVRYRIALRAPTT